MKNIYLVQYHGGGKPILCGMFTNKNYAQDARKIWAEKYHTNIDLISIVKCPTNIIMHEIV